MSILKFPIIFQGKETEKELFTLFDSGSTYSMLSANAVAGLAEPVPLLRPKLIGTASDGHFMQITHAIRLDFLLNGVPLSDEFMIVEGLSEDAIIGVTTLQKWRIKLDFDHDKVEVDPKVAKAILKQGKYRYFT